MLFFFFLNLLDFSFDSKNLWIGMKRIHTEGAIICFKRKCRKAWIYSAFYYSHINHLHVPLSCPEGHSGHQCVIYGVPSSSG